MIFLLTVNYNSSHLIQKLIKSLPDPTETPFKLVIINNSSEDVYLNTLENDFVSIIHSPKNLGFGSACNVGIQSIFGSYRKAIIWLINPDTYIASVNFKEIIHFFDIYPSISILGTIIYNIEGKIWFAGGEFIPARGAILETDLMSKNNQDYVLCDWVSGCSLILNLRNFSIPPLFDQKYFLYYEDLDFCQRYRIQGHLVAITSRFSLIHAPSSITNKNQFEKIKHSTFSYFLTLQRYSPVFIQIIFFLKLFIYAMILLPLKPDIAIGKLVGITNYLNHLKLNKEHLD